MCRRITFGVTAQGRRRAARFAISLYAVCPFLHPDLRRGQNSLSLSSARLMFHKISKRRERCEEMIPSPFEAWDTIRVISGLYLCCFAVRSRISVVKPS